MSELESLTLRAAALSSKADFWNNAVLWALVLTALAAVAIVVSQRLAFVRAKQLGEVQEDITRIKEAGAVSEQKRIATELAAAVARAKEADARIAEAQRGSAEANERATKAQESLSLAEQHSAEANAKAEGFRLDIAQANTRAAEANRIAEQERLARLQLEARLADRILLPIQMQNIEKAFAGLKGKTVDVAILGDAMEIAQFGGKIIDCMRRAGVLINFSRPIGGASARGVLVGVKADAPPEFKQAADAFIAILRQTVGDGVGHWEFDKLVSGGAAMVSKDNGAEPNSPLRIWIGNK